MEITYPHIRLSPYIQPLTTPKPITLTTLIADQGLTVDYIIYIYQKHFAKLVHVVPGNSANSKYFAPQKVGAVRYTAHIHSQPHTTYYLNIFSECSEDLFGDGEGLEQTVSTQQVNGLLARVVPVKVRYGLLQSEKVVDRACDDVDCCCIACLRAQVVLEGCV